MNLNAMGALLGSVILSLAGIEPGNLACGATGPTTSHGELTVEGPGFKAGVGIDYETKGTDPNRTYEAENTSGGTKAGCLRFKDRNGNYVGSPQTISIPPGGSVSGSVPPGATDYEASDEPCEDDDSGDLATSGSGRKYEHFFQGGTLVPDPFGGKDVTYAFTVYTFSSRAATRMKDTILAHGLTAPLPSIRGVDRVEVHFHAESVVDLGNGRLNLTFADDLPFSFLDVGLNGDPTYATLGSAVPVPTANGWDAHLFSLPLSDFDYDPTSGALWSNELDVVYGNVGSPEVFHFYGLLEYESD